MTDRSILTAADWRARHIAGRPPKILRDPELKEFVDGLLPTRTFGEIAERARERFGRTRAPSRAAVGRYWQRMPTRMGPTSRLEAPYTAVHGNACGVGPSSRRRPSSARNASVAIGAG